MQFQIDRDRIIFIIYLESLLVKLPKASMMRRRMSYAVLSGGKGAANGMLTLAKMDPRQISNASHGSDASISKDEIRLLRQYRMLAPLDALRHNTLFVAALRHLISMEGITDIFGFENLKVKQLLGGCHCKLKVLFSSKLGHSPARLTGDRHSTATLCNDLAENAGYLC